VRIYDSYIITLTGLLLATAVAFAFVAESRLDICFSVFLIEVLIVNELFIHLNSRAKKGLNAVNYLLFAGFGIIIVDKIIEVIWKISALEIIWDIIRMKASEVLELL
jgi:heme/copper-type cytochrome/quinol oxidase subunit 4